MKRWPLDVMHLTSPFGMRKHPIEKVMKMHNGTDLRAANGTPIYAPIAGTIIETGTKVTSGNYSVLQGTDGSRQSFVHLTDAAVPKGTTVKAGDLIAWTGDTGKVSGPHLHWGVSVNGKWIDPMKWGPSRMNGPALALAGVGLVVAIRRARG